MEPDPGPPWLRRPNAGPGPTVGGRARTGDRSLYGTVTRVTSIDGRGPLRRQRCVTPDGVGIAVYDFGGEGPDLLLVHATGFCAEPFGPLARQLGGRFRCWALDLRGHGRSDRPDDGDFSWSGFATDVLAVIDHLGLDRPFGVGHSCGGATVLLAEQARPDSFRSLYCFEPVVMPDAARARHGGSEPIGRRSAPAPRDLPVGRRGGGQLRLQTALRRPRSGCPPALRRRWIRGRPGRRGWGRPGRPAAVPPPG